MWVATTTRGQPARPLERIVQPHHQVARIERHPGDIGAQALQNRDQLISGEIGVSLDRQPYPQVHETWSEPLDDLDRPLDLTGPGAFRAKAVVAVSDVHAGVAARSRGHGFHVRHQVQCHLGRLYRSPKLAGAASWVWRRETNLEVKPHGLGSPAKLSQPRPIEPWVDHRRPLKLNAIKMMSPRELQRLRRRESAVGDRVVIKPNPSLHFQSLHEFGCQLSHSVPSRRVKTTISPTGTSPTWALIGNRRL